MPVLNEIEIPLRCDTCKGELLVCSDVNEIQRVSGNGHLVALPLKLFFNPEKETIGFFVFCPSCNGGEKMELSISSIKRVLEEGKRERQDGRL